ncbi:MAG TPA: hypothetical protein PLY95_01480 [Candidatus Paceibacterota bacterium]|nr:hypothetical protein [Candidatus Paceibacterota bacterium]HQI25908.1 hypothetical protein [Candidatus Paceibacterota bacterium]HQJ84020.1 hypothetical protein [Candidatus Paceibacterota bacterium]
MNIIDKFTKKVKWLKETGESEFVKSEKPLFWALVIILTASLSFGLGRLSKIDEVRAPVRVEKTPASEMVVAVGLVGGEQGSEVSEKLIVASKRGKKYHYLWCSGAKTIKEENKIYFATEVEAEQAGYVLAANCQK